MEKDYKARINCVILVDFNDKDYFNFLNMGRMIINKNQIHCITDVDGMCFSYYDRRYKGYIPEANQILKYKISA